MTTFRIKLNGKETDIDVTHQGEHLRISLAGETTDLRLIETNGSSLIFEQELPDGTCKRIRAFGHRDGDKRQLWVNGRIFNYERIRQKSTSAVDDFSNSLSASIPAVVSEVLVQPGDKVIAGDKLILLESMKMVIPIQSPCDGQVIKINCAAGDAVQSGVQLIDIERLEQ